MSRRKRVEMTAVVHRDGDIELMGGGMRFVKEYAAEQGGRAVVLVEYDPRAEAALKTLLAWAESLRPLPTRAELVVARYEKSRKRKA